MESRCDQYVLESLEGEERREYGHILLSMANERFSKTSGSTCINNGGKNIKARIENIARFKKYPQGMGLVSVCVIIILAFPLVVGTKTSAIYEFDDSVYLSFASARSTPCTTAAGAFDAYGRAMIEKDGYYRAMCASEDMQADILKEMLENKKVGIYPIWDSGIDKWKSKTDNFYVYNLNYINEDAYEGLLVIELVYPPDGTPAEKYTLYLAVQKIRVEKENGRWVAIPLEDMRYVETARKNLSWGCTELPSAIYEGETNDWRIEVNYQTVYTIDINSDNYFSDNAPDPNAEFSISTRAQILKCIYLGDEANKDAITHIGLSVAPVSVGEERSNNLIVPSGDYTVGGSNNGEQWISKKLNLGWDAEVFMDGCGYGADPDSDDRPEYFVADLYINNEKVANIDLTLRKGGVE